MTRQRRQLKTTEHETNSSSEAAELRRIIEEQNARLEALTSGIEILLERDSDVRTSLQDMQRYLLDRSDEVQSGIYDLQMAAAVRLADGNTSKQIAYQRLIRRIREVVRTTVPHNATVIVINKGDVELLNLYGRRAWHFPQTEKGEYAGHYPSNSAAAIVHLEILRARGGDYLLFPETSLWWLSHPKYAEFSHYLERRYRVIVQREDTCVIFALREPATWIKFDEAIAECEIRLDREPSILDWNTGLNLKTNFPGRTIFSPPTEEDILPYLDHSVDIVAIASSDPNIRAEAQRVAAEAILEFIPDHEGLNGVNKLSSLSVNWLSEHAVTTLPATSIIIPVHNGVTYTETCLRSLIETLPRNFRGEIIVVDDASTDETPVRLKRWAQTEKRLKIVRNSTNLGFLDSVNCGAKQAKGEVLVFLNNDTVLLSGWLPPLLRILQRFPEAGAVGGKLLFPDGTLQEAGGIIFHDGSAAHFGRGDHDPNALVYNYVREVDYCSGALLATPRSLFRELGGFDTYYRPAYYEDTDYCFKIRKKGLRVYYQPESVVVHLEGASSGNDLTRGVKRYQIVNYDKFLERWEEVLKWQPARPAYDDVMSWKALAMRGGFSGRTKR